jgi:hypothetical protein
MPSNDSAPNNTSSQLSTNLYSSCSDPKSQHSLSFSSEYNQERRANRFILFDIAISGPRISEHVDDHLLYTLYQYQHVQLRPLVVLHVPMHSS